MQTRLITPDSEPLPRKQLAAMVSKFKRRNPSFIDEDDRSSEPASVRWRVRIQDSQRSLQPMSNAGAQPATKGKR
jgi:hypothetical protein